MEHLQRIVKYTLNSGNDQPNTEIDIMRVRKTRILIPNHI